MPSTPQIPNEKNLPIEIAEQFIKLQYEEIAIKKAEIELKKQQDQNNYEFSKESLKYQAEDLKDLRSYLTRKDKKGFWIFVMILLLFFSVIFVALFLNKDQLIGEILKTIAWIFGGGATGYAIGRNKQQKNSAQDKTAQ